MVGLTVSEELFRSIGGATVNFKKVPVKRLVDVIDWDSVVSAYRGGSATDYEMENTAVLLGIEHEI